MGIFSESKIDAHCHILDPAHFPYAADVVYQPQGQEIGDQSSLEHVMACYGVQHALLVGPNSGYNTDNRCLLHAVATGNGRFKGIAVVQGHISDAELSSLKQQGVVGVAFNVALHGMDYYSPYLKTLLRRMQAMDLWANIQVTANQLPELLPLLEGTDVRMLIDHCGRPFAQQGLQQAGFQDLLALGREGRAIVKLSGEAKFSAQGFPFDDARPYWDALIQAFGLQGCLWASDWPYLRAPFRLDYGPMLKRWESYLSAPERHQLMWDNPKRLFGF